MSVLFTGSCCRELNDICLMIPADTNLILDDKANFDVVVDAGFVVYDSIWSYA